MITTAGKTPLEVVQEIFDALVEQGKVCNRPGGGGCVYGDGNGNHCAVGLLAPEDNSDFMGYEGDVQHLVNEMDNFDDLENADFIRDNLELMTVVQAIHDSGYMADFFALCKLGYEYGRVASDWMHIVYGVRRDELNATIVKYQGIQS